MIVKAVAVIIANLRGEVLLQLREERQDLEFPSYWTVPGGRVEKLETPYEAALREL